MLDELKNHEFRGGKDELLFFICDVIRQNTIKTQDAAIICSHVPGKRNLFIKDMINYCVAFDWIEVENDVISLSSHIAPYVSDKDVLNEKLILDTVEQLFAEGIFDSSLFAYDTFNGHYSFKNELFPLSLSSVRDVLISQGFLIAERNARETKFYIASLYDSLVARNCTTKRKQLSLERLKKQIDDNELAGEKAELFVLSFEKERLGESLSNRIKRISEIDVTAGYDIVSFDSSHSKVPDRFIEVKAISRSGFFWSKNELDVAKLKGTMYYLYLVELGRVGEPGYIPEIIQNPAINIIESDNWYVETQSYHIMHI